MPDLVFPDGFLWGAATAAHQVEGDNDGSDWWDWERRPGTPCVDRSDLACDHYHRYPEDIALLASLGLNAYRYSVEWARVEPQDGCFDEAQLDHYDAVTDAVLAAGMTPVVTLNHFSLPRWVAAHGGWLGAETPARFARYTDRVVRRLGDRAAWWCTINEPGVVAFGGYLGALNFPPGRTDMGSWERATRRLVDGHRLALAAIRAASSTAKAGMTHQLMEWAADDAGRPFVDWVRRRNEDVFLDAAADDDFVGVQTYTRVTVRLNPVLGALLRVVLRVPAAAAVALPPVIRSQAQSVAPPVPPGARRTQMGYELRPEALAATVRRVASLLPGKDILVTETGIATADDAERVTYIEQGLRALHAEMAAGAPVRGYLYWSALDNFEWALGYRMQFGLVGVDHATQERTVRPSARRLGQIARANRLSASTGAADPG
jgi:beta-glucosidase